MLLGFPMRTLQAIAVGLGVLIWFAAPAMAVDAIPYPNPGTYNSQAYTFTATTTADLVVYFAGAASYYDNQLGVLVNGAPQGGYGLDDHTSSVGDSYDYGQVTAGDVVTFVLHITEPNTPYSQRPGQTIDLWSDPSLNALYGYDGPGATQHNHVYLTDYTGGIGDPNSALYQDTGYYLGFEDLAFGDFSSIRSDYDYNDENFVITQQALNVTPLPEPSSWALLLIGFLGVGTALRMKRSGALAV